ncbi:hypothetical protein IWW45_009317, partial [Coemansia sp. RSA 485]
MVLSTPLSQRRHGCFAHGLGQCADMCHAAVHRRDDGFGCADSSFDSSFDSFADASGECFADVTENVTGTGNASYNASCNGSRQNQTYQTSALPVPMTSDSASAADGSTAQPSSTQEHGHPGASAALLRIQRREAMVRRAVARRIVQQARLRHRTRLQHRRHHTRRGHRGNSIHCLQSSVGADAADCIDRIDGTENISSHASCSADCSVDCTSNFFVNSSVDCTADASADSSAAVAAIAALAAAMSAARTGLCIDAGFLVDNTHMAATSPPAQTSVLESESESELAPTSIDAPATAPNSLQMQAQAQVPVPVPVPVLSEAERQ